jgi:hypothetical protein
MVLGDAAKKGESNAAARLCRTRNELKLNKRTLLAFYGVMVKGGSSHEENRNRGVFMPARRNGLGSDH